MTDIGDWIAKLKPLAREVSRHAYSPYSGFNVGTAVVGSDGMIHIGCNLESASYGLTQCAERNALGAAIAAGAGKGSLHTMLIYEPGDVIFAPCGACRQIISELMTADALIISCCDGEDYMSWAKQDLLPYPFTLE